MPLDVEVNFEWVQQPGDTAPCTSCKEPIYGNMFIKAMKLEGEYFEINGSPKVCESCYTELCRNS